MLGLTTAAGVHGPVCLVFSSHSQSCPKGTANNGELTSLFTCVILHKWPNSSAAQKIVGTMEPWQTPRRPCTSIMLSNKITNQSLVNPRWVFFLSLRNLNCLFSLLWKYLGLMLNCVKWQEKQLWSPCTARLSQQHGSSDPSETIRKSPFHIQRDGSLWWANMWDSSQDSGGATCCVHPSDFRQATSKGVGRQWRGEEDGEGACFRPAPSPVPFSYCLCLRESVHTLQISSATWRRRQNSLRQLMRQQSLTRRSKEERQSRTLDWLFWTRGHTSPPSLNFSLLFIGIKEESGGN